MPFPLALGAALLPSIYQGIKGITQKNQASNLKFSDYDYIPEEYRMNQKLAAEQAYSRRAPGAAFAESNVRRTQANQIAAGMRGSDANKAIAITSAATGQANDANARIAAQGQQFSEGAFGRLANANAVVGQQKRQNYNDYWQRVGQLNQSGDQNIFNSISNIGTAGVLGAGSGGVDGSVGGQMGTGGRGGFSNRWMQMMNGYGMNPYSQQPYQGQGVWGSPGGFNPALLNGGRGMGFRKYNY